VLTRFVNEGLQRNERILYLGHRFDRGSVLEYLRDAGVAAEGYCRSGQLILQDGRHDPRRAWFARGFQPERSVRVFQQAAAQAIADGYRGLRVASESDWLLSELVSPPDWVEFELGVNDLVVGTPLIGLCGYDARLCDHDWLLALQAVHTRRITGPSARQSPFAIGGDGRKIVIEGAVDWSCRESLRRALRAAVSCGSEELVIDLGPLRFIDLSCLRILVELGRELGLEGRSLRLRSCTEIARMVLHPSLGFDQPWTLQLD
jgi:anti-anti-sigma regulatory factor